METKGGGGGGGVNGSLKFGARRLEEMGRSIALRALAHVIVMEF